jgi:hypothetical protein
MADNTNKVKVIEVDGETTWKNKNEVKDDLIEENGNSQSLYDIAEQTLGSLMVKQTVRNSVFMVITLEVLRDPTKKEELIKFLQNNF